MAAGTVRISANGLIEVRVTKSIWVEVHGRTAPQGAGTGEARGKECSPKPYRSAGG
jgi:hypothetical protein